MRIIYVYDGCRHICSPGEFSVRAHIPWAVDQQISGPNVNEAGACFKLARTATQPHFMSKDSSLDLQKPYRAMSSPSGIYKIPQRPLPQLEPVLDSITSRAGTLRQPSRYLRRIFAVTLSAWSKSEYEIHSRTLRGLLSCVPQEVCNRQTLQFPLRFRELTAFGN